MTELYYMTCEKAQDEWSGNFPALCLEILDAGKSLVPDSLLAHKFSFFSVRAK